MLLGGTINLVETHLELLETVEHLDVVEAFPLYEDAPKHQVVPL